MNGARQLMVISHVELRRFVGGLGALFPLLLMVSGLLRGVPIQPSLSHYYSLDGSSRDLFVGVLCAIATFFWTYRGYDRKDRWAARSASLFALGVAFLPHRGTDLEQVLHYGSALGLLGTLAYFALCLFTKSDGAPTPEKRRRNLIYVTCGLIILGCVILMPLTAILVQRFPWGQALVAWNPILWIESAAIWAFSLAWLVKGEVLFRDAAGCSSGGTRGDNSAVEGVS